MTFTHRQRGATFGKVLLLLFFLALAVGYWYWKLGYGKIGSVKPLNFNSKDYVAFLRSEGDRTNLYAVKVDGTDERRLTDDFDAKQGLCWSPDGKQLCYSAEVKEENTRAYQLFLFGSEGAKRLTYGSGSKLAPEWSPNGKQIAFMVGGTLKVVDTRGENMRQLYPHYHKAEAGEQESEEEKRKRPPVIAFRWSPDSSTLAAVQVTEGEEAMVRGQSDWDRPRNKTERDLHEVPDPEMLIVLPAGDNDPVLRPETNSKKVTFCWFPEGKQIAAAWSNRKKQHRIAILNADDRRVFSPYIFEANGFTVAPENPAVSPDGSRLAFEVWKLDSAENRELYGIAVISTDPNEKVTIHSAADLSKLKIVAKGRTTNPRWSADGSRLIYQVTNPSGKRDVWSVAADGTDAKNLTNGKGDNFTPACSPAK